MMCDAKCPTHHILKLDDNHFESMLIWLENRWEE